MHFPFAALLFLQGVSLARGFPCRITADGFQEYLSPTDPSLPSDGVLLSRGPCPGLNALANHCYLPHDGRNITPEQVVEAIFKHLNVDKQIVLPLANASLKVSDNPSKGTFDLHQLAKHNILEHDGSLTRPDTTEGKQSKDLDLQKLHRFINHFEGNKTVNLSAAAKARYDAILDSRNTNPHHNMTSKQKYFSLFETTSYLLVLQDEKTGEFPVEWVKDFFSKPAAL
jgi:hypothetical protein